LLLCVVLQADGDGGTASANDEYLAGRWSMRGRDQVLPAPTRRLSPRWPEITFAFAFAVFLAPGIAPFIVSNPMNLIVAEYAGSFNSYAAVMLPISLAGAVLTHGVLRWA
jgi:hypothetical protein